MIGKVLVLDFIQVVFRNENQSIDFALVIVVRRKLADCFLVPYATEIGGLDELVHFELDRRIGEGIYKMLGIKHDSIPKGIGSIHPCLISKPFGKDEVVLAVN